MLGEAGKSPEAIKGLDLYLYDCTIGECFSQDFALPSSNEQRLVVRKPASGRWVVMIGAPSFPSAGAFAIEGIVVVAQGSKTINLGQPLRPNETRTVSLNNPGTGPSTNAIRVYELFDGAVSRAETEQPWVDTSDLEKLSGRPAALGIVATPVVQH
jgi:hypothetical protein